MHVAFQVDARPLRRVVEMIQVGQQVRPGRPIVAFGKLANQQLGVASRVPHQVGQQPGRQTHEVAHRTAGVALLEQPDDVMIDEEADVGGQDPQVGMRQNIVGEIGHVVPDEQVRGDAAPVLRCRGETSRSASPPTAGRTSTRSSTAARRRSSAAGRSSAACACTGRPASRRARRGTRFSIASATAFTNRSSGPDGLPSSASTALHPGTGSGPPVVLADGDKTHARALRASAARALRASSLTHFLVGQAELGPFSAVRLPRISLYHSGCRSEILPGGNSG